MRDLAARQQRLHFGDHTVRVDAGTVILAAGGRCYAEAKQGTQIFVNGFEQAMAFVFDFKLAGAWSKIDPFAGL